MSPRMKRVLVIVGALLVAAVVGGWVFGFGPIWADVDSIDPTDHGGIQSLQLVPFPEGPNSPLFERNPSGGSVPLSTVLRFVPDPLPRPRWQGLTCGMGGDLVVTFADGTSVSYGPCKRPDSIDRLWSRMIEALDPGCPPRCGPG